MQAVAAAIRAAVETTVAVLSIDMVSPTNGLL
jgi:hypothetical protein